MSRRVARLLDAVAVAAAIAVAGVSLGILTEPVDHTPAYVDLGPSVVDLGPPVAGR